MYIKGRQVCYFSRDFTPVLNQTIETGSCISAYTPNKYLFVSDINSTIDSALNDRFDDLSNLDGDELSSFVFFLSVLAYQFWFGRRP
ncbi:ASB_collapsed_G0010790.mRNA.1.CDS.1 [Saccharomyces cerevisiae]|nr:ASB_collapsed_G0010790.mRNA.1.CDS.1 [Saccharomyces cerevisiae]